jgi:hypothetical protein
MERRPKEFDAVAESRKWREAAALALEGKSVEEVVAFYAAVANQHRTERATRRSRVISATK